jgi:hypothetical protein|nr:MAG TPA: hypothetical protein [Caudoviricetes sp.]DAQ95668.1 MAG TPA: hypothetical protein [Caudoviricetes sp.]
MSRVVRLSFDDLLPPDDRYTCKQNDEWYIIQCPKCREELNYEKTKLYLSKSLDFGYCHRCNRVFLDNTLNINAQNLRADSILSYLKAVRCTDYLDEFRRLGDIERGSETIDEKGIAYFRHRGNNKLIREYRNFDLRFSDDGIYIPYYFDGEIKYYIKRLYKPIGDMKYFLPPIKSKPYYLIDRGSDVYVICEGPFDAMSIAMVYPDVNVLAISGSTMTTAQINSLDDRLPDKIVVWLDNTELSTNLRDKLKRKIIYADYSIVNSNGDDPEEMLIQKLQ